MKTFYGICFFFLSRRGKEIDKRTFTKYWEHTQLKESAFIEIFFVKTFCFIYSSSIANFIFTLRFFLFLLIVNCNLVFFPFFLFVWKAQNRFVNRKCVYGPGLKLDRCSQNIRCGMFLHSIWSNFPNDQHSLNTLIHWQSQIRLTYSSSIHSWFAKFTPQFKHFPPHSFFVILI